MVRPRRLDGVVDRRPTPRGCLRDRYHRFPLSGAPARTLCRAAGWEPDGPPHELGSWTWALYARFRTRNVFRRYANATPWSLPKAREQALTLLTDMPDDGSAVAVLLGRRVAAAFGLERLPFFRWERTLSGMFVVVPHPSGRNHLMNDAAIRHAVGVALRAAVDGPTTDKIV